MLMLSPGEKLGAVVGLSLTPKLVAIAVRSIRDDQPGPIQPSGVREAPGRITKTGALAFAAFARTLCESIPSGWILDGFAKDVPAIMRQFQHPQGFQVDLFTGEHAAAIFATGITVTFRGFEPDALNDIGNFVAPLVGADAWPSELEAFLAPQPAPVAAAPPVANGHDASEPFIVIDAPAEITVAPTAGAAPMNGLPSPPFDALVAGCNSPSTLSMSSRFASAPGPARAPPPAPAPEARRRRWLRLARGCCDRPLALGFGGNDRLEAWGRSARGAPRTSPRTSPTSQRAWRTSASRPRRPRTASTEICRASAPARAGPGAPGPGHRRRIQTRRHDPRGGGRHAQQRDLSPDRARRRRL